MGGVHPHMLHVQKVAFILYCSRARLSCKSNSDKASPMLPARGDPARVSREGAPARFTSTAVMSLGLAIFSSSEGLAQAWFSSFLKLRSISSEASPPCPFSGPLPGTSK